MRALDKPLQKRETPLPDAASGPGNATCLARRSDANRGGKQGISAAILPVPPVGLEPTTL